MDYAKTFVLSYSIIMILLILLIIFQDIKPKKIAWLRFYVVPAVISGIITGIKWSMS